MAGIAFVDAHPAAEALPRPPKPGEGGAKEARSGGRRALDANPFEFLAAGPDFS
jgi:hypothetical protein